MNILNKKETLREYQKEIDYIAEHDFSAEAFKLSLKINKALEESNDLNNEFLEAYNKIINKARFIFLFRLSEKELLELISSHFNEIFNIEEYDIFNKFDNFLSYKFEILKDRDNFKNELAKKILISKEKLTQEKIFISSEEKKGSVQNWLTDFRNEYSEEGFLNSLNVSQYLLHNKNFERLSEDQKYKVKTLLNFYAKLKRTSFDSGEIEGDSMFTLEDGSYKIYSKGEVIEIETGKKSPEIEIKDKNLGSKKVFKANESKENNISSLESKPKQGEKSIKLLLLNYKNFEKDMVNLQAEIEDLSKEINDLDFLFQEYKDNISDKNKVFSIIILLAKNKKLNIFIKNYSDLLLKFKKYLLINFSDDVADNIIENYENPESISLYLQFLLSGLKISERESALFGMYLANIFKKTKQEKYFSIVYGDLNLESFVWRKVIDEAGSVKFK